VPFPCSLPLSPEIFFPCIFFLPDPPPFSRLDSARPYICGTLFLENPSLAFPGSFLQQAVFTQSKFQVSRKFPHSLPAPPFGSPFFFFLCQRPLHAFGFKLLHFYHPERHCFLAPVLTKVSPWKNPFIRHFLLMSLHFSPWVPSKGCLPALIFFPPAINSPLPTF